MLEMELNMSSKLTILSILQKLEKIQLRKKYLMSQILLSFLKSLHKKQTQMKKIAENY